MKLAHQRLLPMLLLVASGALHAQQYPSKPIRILVGFAAGGPTEVAARLVGQKLTEKWGQQVLVEARPGAGGNIAGEAVAKAAPDGYTLLLPAFAHAVNPALNSKMPFDTEKDFASVAMVATSSNVLAVHPSVAANSLKELIALAKSQPGKLTFGSAGNGTASHLAGELLNSMAGIKITHVPYKGAAPASADLIGGHISAAFPSVALALPQIKAGKIRPIGVASLKRSDNLPGVPDAIVYYALSRERPDESTGHCPDQWVIEITFAPDADRPGFCVRNSASSRSR